jgi:hypothetical protein
VVQVLRTYPVALNAGAVVIVEDGGCRVRRLPIQH